MESTPIAGRNIAARFDHRVVGISRKALEVVRRHAGGGKKPRCAFNVSCRRDTGIGDDKRPRKAELTRHYAEPRQRTGAEDHARPQRGIEWLHGPRQLLYLPDPLDAPRQRAQEEM
jgi:hypothetical protein